MEILLYGFDDQGETKFSEVLEPASREELRVLALARLERCHAVEVWEGALCILRLRRDTPQAFDS